IGSEVYTQELNATLLENEEYIRGEALAAVDRIDAGTFGTCENCGAAIPAERLEVLPYVRYCVGCAEKLDSGKAVNLNDGRRAGRRRGRRHPGEQAGDRREEARRPGPAAAPRRRAEQPVGWAIPRRGLTTGSPTLRRVGGPVSFPQRPPPGGEHVAEQRPLAE